MLRDRLSFQAARVKIMPSYKALSAASFKGSVSDGTWKRRILFLILRCRFLKYGIVLSGNPCVLANHLFHALRSDNIALVYSR
jgi:hypothetical protein